VMSSIQLLLPDGSLSGQGVPTFRFQFKVHSIGVALPGIC
jgi:hypothetical protein